MVRLHSTLYDQSNLGIRQSKASYQGYIWPRDFQTKRFLKDWKYYSVMVTAAPEKVVLATEVTTTETNIGTTVQEQWFFYHNKAGWKQLDTIRPHIHIGACQGEPPTAIAMEYFDEGVELYYGAYFPIMPPIDKIMESKEATLGIDFGTSNTCAAAKIGSDVPNVIIQMNPSDLLYPVFASQRWQQNELDFGWVPYFSIPRPGSHAGTAEIFPTGLHTLDKTAWDKIELHQQDNELLFVSRDEHLPLVHFTIPGDKLDKSIRNEPDYTIYNIKWAPNHKQRLVYWKDFFTTYLLFLGAHLFMGRQFPAFRFDTLHIKATMPLKFRTIGVDLPKEFFNFTDMGEAFEQTLEAAVNEVSQLSGLRFSYEESSYEAVTPILAQSELYTDGLFVVVDIGSDTTDVAVLQGSKCISTSSFVFGANNLFSEAFGKDYINAQLALPTSGDPMEGRGNLLQDFLFLMSTYTALLTGAAILQTDLEPEKLSDLRICLHGGGWHLAQFDPIILGAEDAAKVYVRKIIIPNILDIFNKKILPEVQKASDKRYEELKPSNILIANNAVNSMISCALGAINPLSIDVQSASKITFLGISYQNAQEKIEWYENKSRKSIRSYTNIKRDCVCPNLLIGPDNLEQVLLNDTQWVAMSGSGPFEKGYVKRNYVEYLLEVEIGGYDLQAQFPRMNTDLIIRLVPK